ncbi:family 16 glycosylhydrolase [Flammeovirga sp. SubArs3]|uniref:family 16 glycosylhydrolase n=1 Tax=Flammeovirga sp. SubArs3 TaxID=2995316 RepID=UPI00248B302F|nr:family 16 glycosylhydrolase [Flammeovirga sp. SubArs3]
MKNKRTKMLLLFLMIAAFTNHISAQTPVSHGHLEWELDDNQSDEFESLDTQKWENDPNDWGVWSWEPSLAYVEDNELKIKMIQETHRRDTNYGSNQELYYKSGIIRNNRTITYGYFEAKIKGADRFPGVSPAFWLYSINQPDPTEDGQAKYSEIDVVELTQREWDFENNDWEGPEAIDMNLHAVARENGELIQIRPHKTPEIAQNKWIADFDPREDYHTYGVLSRVDSIFWYVDGVERGRKENLYWHLPMHITVSMGLRAPFVEYIEDGSRRPVPDSTTTVGFPTEMACQYVRVWKAKSQIYADKDQYSNVEFAKADGINFISYFDAGSGSVAASNLEVELHEMDENGESVEVVGKSQALIVGKAAGETASLINIQNVKNTSELDDGHYYEITASFTSTENEEETITLTTSIKDLQIVDQITSSDIDLGQNIELYPNPTSSSFRLKGIQGPVDISILNPTGNVVLESSITPNTEVDVRSLTNGVYIVKVNIGGKVYTKRLLKL